LDHDHKDAGFELNGLIAFAKDFQLWLHARPGRFGASKMPRRLGTVAQGMVAAAACVLTWHTPPALAQQSQQCEQNTQANAIGDAYFAVGPIDLDRPFECQAHKESALNFAGYYAPYAIQAALAYRSDHQIQPGPNDLGDPTNAEKAKRLFREWQYQFDSDSYVICAKPGDKDCNSDQSDRWILFSTYGLYYQVWARYRPNNSCSEVSIAFRGTVNSSIASFIASWSSNAHSFARRAHIDDEYDQLARRVDAVINQIKQLPCYKRAGSAQIVSVGHSLGGGLAEFAALAHDPNVGRIAKVFTFNTSPITAPDLISNQRWNDNRQRLTIDRIFQEGEVLTAYSAIRDQQQTPAFSCDPLTRTVQFSAVKPGGPKTKFERAINWFSPGAYSSYELHGIGPLAAKLVEWADEHQRSYEPLPVYHTTCVPEPYYQMLPPPQERETAPTVSYRGVSGNYAAANFDSLGTTLQTVRHNKKSSQDDVAFRREAYGSTDSGAMTTQSSQFGPIYAVMTERSVSVAKLTRARRSTIKPPLVETSPRTHMVSF
jgi:pimeloyl-ACP methyl ester carboxylesterase